MNLIEFSCNFFNCTPENLQIMLMAKNNREKLADCIMKNGSLKNKSSKIRQSQSCF